MSDLLVSSDQAHNLTVFQAITKNANVQLHFLLKTKVVFFPLKNPHETNVAGIFLTGHITSWAPISRGIGDQTAKSLS